MLNKGKKNILGILIDAVDYEAAVEFVLCAAKEKRAAAITALAVHGLMTGVLDRVQKFRLNHFDLVVPDGQPVRWGVNWLYGGGLVTPVVGRNLTLKLCSAAASAGVRIYLYGSTSEVLISLQQSLKSRFPGLIIAGSERSKFRPLSHEEKLELAVRIRDSGACMVFVGLGCPRQEHFAFEFRDLVSMPIVAVGAAFPFLAGKLPEAPQWMQDFGLEWLFRFSSEPSRLWRRYVLLNPTYLFLVALQVLGFMRFSTEGRVPLSKLLDG